MEWCNNMWWNILATIGTTLSAIATTIGILLTVYQLNRKLNFSIIDIPECKIIVSNNATKSVTITKMVYSIGKKEPVYVRYNDNQEDGTILPAQVKVLDFQEDILLDEYFSSNYLKGKEDKIIYIYAIDNYNRKYKIKTNITLENLGCFAQ